MLLQPELIIIFRSGSGVEGFVLVRAFENDLSILVLNQEMIIHIKQKIKPAKILFLRAKNIMFGFRRTWAPFSAVVITV